MTSSEWTDEVKAKHLANIYYAAGDPGSLGGVNRLLQRARQVGLPVNEDDVKRFLASQLTYTIHRQARHNFERNKTYVGRIDQQWQADLADMQKLSHDNKGYKYILTCIDVLSRHAWAVPVRSKHAGNMLTAMKELFRKAHPRKPERLQTDKGLEFFNSQVSAFLKQHNVNHFASNSDQKAALCERFNRTLKERLWRYFTANGTRKYVDVLDDVV
jgi:transposase InsO family protein